MKEMKLRTVSSLLGMVPPEIVQYIEPKVLIPGSRLLVFGETGIGKSLFAETLAFSLVSGRPFVGLHVPVARRVLLLQAEVPEDEFWGRTVKMDRVYGVKGTPAGENFFVAHVMDHKINRWKDFKEIEGVVREIHPDVVIFDPMYKFMSGEDTNQGALKAMFDVIDEGLIAPYNCAVVIVHNSRQAPQVNGVKLNLGMQEARGHTTIIDWADVILQLRKTPEGHKLTFEKSRHATPPATKTVAFNEEDLVFTEVEELDIAAAVLAAVGVGPTPMKAVKEGLAKELSISQRTVERAVEKLRAAGVLFARKNPERGNEVQLIRNE